MPMIVTDRINQGLKPGQNWTTPLHKLIAEFALGENPTVPDKETLQKYVTLINAIPKSEVHKTNCKTLKDMGIDIP